MVRVKDSSGNPFFWDLTAAEAEGKSQKKIAVHSLTRGHEAASRSPAGKRPKSAVPFA